MITPFMKRAKTMPEKYLENMVYPEGAAIQVVLLAMGLDWLCQPTNAFVDNDQRLYELIRENGSVASIGTFRNLLVYLGHKGEESGADVLILE